MPIPDLLANAGTPLMWATGCMLVFGNFVLGLFETWLLTVLAKVEVPFWWLVLANYASMGVGYILLNNFGGSAIANADPLENAMRVVWLSWAVAFLVTLLVEWPFFSLVRGRFGFSAKGLKWAVVVNVISYACLLGLASVLGRTNAITDLRRVSLSEITAMPAWVYYADAKSQQVWRIRTDSGEKQRVAHLPEQGEYEFSEGWTRLTLEPRSDKENADLLIRFSDKEHVLAKRVARKGTFAPAESMDDKGRYVLGNLTFGLYAALSWHKDSTVYNGFWQGEGLRVSGKRYIFETPVASVVWRSVTEMPDGKIVANFGKQIVILDPATKRIANVTPGFGAAVMLDKAPTSASP